jgi:hypothetical protein
MRNPRVWHSILKTPGRRIVLGIFLITEDERKT